MVQRKARRGFEDYLREVAEGPWREDAQVIVTSLEGMEADLDRASSELDDLRAQGLYKPEHVDPLTLASSLPGALRPYVTVPERARKLIAKAREVYQTALTQFQAIYDQFKGTPIDEKESWINIAPPPVTRSPHERMSASAGPYRCAPSM